MSYKPHPGEDKALDQQIIDVYIHLKDQINQHGQGVDTSEEQREEWADTLKNLGNVVIIGYIKSSVDILVSLMAD
jgi:hypothetical protein